MYLEDKCTLDEACELLKKNTRNYAKRQLTWFRKDKRLNWITIKEDDSHQKIVKGIIDESKD